jgi:hypothetical protein
VDGVVAGAVVLRVVAGSCVVLGWLHFHAAIGDTTYDDIADDRSGRNAANREAP